MLTDLIDTLTPWFAEWGLLIIFVAVFLESSVFVASVLPGEAVLLFGGFLSSPNSILGESPPLHLEQVIAIAFTGALLGDLFGYVLGRVAGRAIVRRFGRYFFLPERRLPVLETYFLRYGGRAVLFGRFAPFLRSIRTLVAGIARLPAHRLVVPDLVGAAVWTTAIATLGYLLGESWEIADRYLGAGGFVIFVILAVLFNLSWRRVRKAVQRELDNAGRADEDSPPREHFDSNSDEQG